jgi:hypothetical protein
VTTLLVDLTALDHLGSAQIALLVRIWKPLRKRDGRMIVQVTSDPIRDSFTAANLHLVWVLVFARDESLRVIRGATIPTQSPIRAGWRWGWIAACVAVVALVALIVSMVNRNAPQGAAGQPPVRGVTDSHFTP